MTKPDPNEESAALALNAESAKANVALGILVSVPPPDGEPREPSPDSWMAWDNDFNGRSAAWLG
jgi:hypothetical protein